MSSAYLRAEQQLTATLKLTRRPIAVTFCKTLPAGVTKFEGVQPSGCSFWRLAEQGRVFYTVPSDHLNCPVGSYTHNVPLSPERDAELSNYIGLMVDVGYIRREEVARIPRVAETPAAVVYAPLGNTPIDPDSVIVIARPRGFMLLYEAALRSGAELQPLRGRPTCMAISASMDGPIVSSLGCIGNRVYTEI